MVGRHEVNTQRKRQLDDLTQVISTPAGSRVVRRILDACQLYDPTSGLDPGSLAYRSGKRDVALWLISEVTEADPRGFAKLLHEAASDTIQVQNAQKEGSPDDDY